MILSISNLSEGAATSWLGASEIFLLVSAVILTLGLIGEWPDTESWRHRKLYKLAKLAVVLGVVGELFGDAGIFETSARLSELQQIAIHDANTRTETLRRQNIALEKAVAPRLLEQGISGEALKPFSGSEAFIVSIPDFETRYLAQQIKFMLEEAKWKTTLLIKDDDGIMPGVCIWSISGIETSADRQRLIAINMRARDAMNVLVAQLKASDIDAVAIPLSPMMPIPHGWDDPQFSRDAIIIRVGLKPITEEFTRKRGEELMKTSPRGIAIFGNRSTP